METRRSITIEWNGKVYRRYPDSKRRHHRVYWARSLKPSESKNSNGGVAYLHREVWQFHNGPVPEGHHIHHVDGNTLNNDITNLRAIDAFEHLSEHTKEAWASLSPTDRARRIIRFRSNPEAKFAWTNTALGKIILRRNGQETMRKVKPRELACQACGKSFITKALQNTGRFCSNKCKSAARRLSGVDDRPRTCEVCLKTYMVGKYLKRRTCSRTCGQVLARSKNISTGRWKLEGAR